MKLVILDTFASAHGEPLYAHFDGLPGVSELSTYDRTPYDLTLERIGAAELVITNKCLLDRDILSRCPNLKYIGVTATGYNNIDIDTAKALGITVTNVSGYSSDGVAQLVFAYILDAFNMVETHDRQVKDGAWTRAEDFCFYDTGLRETAGKTIGIVGFGSIAKRVTTIALAFGMQVIAYTRTVREEDQMFFPQVRFVPLDELLQESDIISLHCPLTEQTEGMFDYSRFSAMKPGAIFINAARGPIVNEGDLARALKEGLIARAYADVASSEPIAANNPLLTAKNMTITPHIAWAAKETRVRLVDMVYDNLRAFLNGKPVNKIV